MPADRLPAASFARNLRVTLPILQLLRFTMGANSSQVTSQLSSTVGSPKLRCKTASSVMSNPAGMSVHLMVRSVGGVHIGASLSSTWRRVIQELVLPNRSEPRSSTVANLPTSQQLRSTKLPQGLYSVKPLGLHSAGIKRRTSNLRLVLSQLSRLLLLTSAVEILAAPPPPSETTKSLLQIMVGAMRSSTLKATVSMVSWLQMSLTLKIK